MRLGVGARELLNIKKAKHVVCKWNSQYQSRNKTAYNTDTILETVHNLTGFHVISGIDSTSVFL
jgi:hypothetical protein